MSRPTITRFIHLRWLAGSDYAAKGGITIAYDAIDLNDERVVLYAVAKCHDKDNYVKRVGRDKAAGRLKAKNHDMYGNQLVLPLQASLKDVRDAIIIDAGKKWPWNPILIAESQRLTQ